MRVTDEILAEYIEICQDLTAMEDRKRELKKELEDAGTMATANYFLVVRHMSKSEIRSLHACAEVYGMEDLVRKGLIECVDYTIVNVAKRP